MSYKIIEEFSHSDICSDPDNQNKAKVCVFVGFDAKGDKMYDLHERRVRNGNLTALLRLFRKSEFGARFREAEHSNTHTTLCLEHHRDPAGLIRVPPPVAI